MGNEHGNNMAVSSVENSKPRGGIVEVGWKISETLGRSLHSLA
jgi:hypothetical protein